MKENENEWIKDAGRQIDKRRTPVGVAKTKGLNAKIRKKGYSILVEGLHSEHWYGKTGSESPVNPTAQAYVVGWVQLPNSQKLAERQSCYSSPKENLIEDRWRRRKQPTTKSKGKLHWTKLWERRNWLGSATKSSANKRRWRKVIPYPWKTRDMIGTIKISANQHETRKRRYWHY